MHKIKIILLTAERQRKIPISPAALRKIISPIIYFIFTEDHTSDKLFGPGSAIDIRIVFLQEILEMLIMMISEFYEHEKVRIVFTDHILYSRIVGIIFVDIGKQDLERTDRGGMLDKGIGIEMRKLERIQKE
jgi:hypothetical protein